jgi:formylglycine-generating enzyme required for sulfatase activity
MFPGEKTLNLRTLILTLAAFVLSAGMTSAVYIDLVPVGNPGNAVDPKVMLDGTTGYGSVAYTYLIGKYEITNAQWREFLNAKAKLGDPYGLYNPNMGGNGQAGGISRSGAGTLANPYVYYPLNGDANWDNRPVAYVSFWDAARFCNWLHNGQVDGNTESGAYINVGNQDTFARQPGAKYFIPTENEWYKAAYYDPNKLGGGGYWLYPTGAACNQSNLNNGNPEGDTGNSANYYDYHDYTIGSPYYTTPVGYFSLSKSPYGTFDQGGNLWEWNEDKRYSTARSVRGGAFNAGDWGLDAAYRNYYDPTFESAIGFRVASVVPEPGCLVMLLGFAIMGGLIYWKRRNANP